MKGCIRSIALAIGFLFLVDSAAQAQERSATRQGFELAANSGKKILLFRPSISVGAQSTARIFEPNGAWTNS